MSTPRRILFTANPLFGHVNAVLPVAQAARDAGHEVVLATGPDLTGHVRRHGIEALATGPTAATSRARHGDRWLELFAASGQARAEFLVPWARRWRPDVVAHDETELAGAVVAPATGARHAVLGLGQMPSPRICAALAPALTAAGERHGVLAAGERLAAATYLERCPPSLAPTHPRWWTSVQRIRPDPPASPRDEHLPRALDALPYERTVHLTLGTVFHHRPQPLETAIDALRGLDVNLVLTSGPGSDPGRFGRQPPHVLIEPYLPISPLLARCSLLVSQGGSGGVFAALAAGLPQLILPQGADQGANAAACLRAGVALVLAPEQVTTGEMVAAVDRLLTQPAWSTAAQAVRVEIEAMPAPAAALGALLASGPDPTPTIHGLDPHEGALR